MIVAAVLVALVASTLPPAYAKTFKPYDAENFTRRNVKAMIQLMFHSMPGHLFYGRMPYFRIWQRPIVYQLYIADGHEFAIFFHKSILKFAEQFNIAVQKNRDPDEAEVNVRIIVITSMRDAFLDPRHQEFLLGRIPKSDIEKTIKRFEKIFIDKRFYGKEVIFNSFSDEYKEFSSISYFVGPTPEDWKNKNGLFLNIMGNILFENQPIDTIIRNSIFARHRNSVLPERMSEFDVFLLDTIYRNRLILPKTTKIGVPLFIERMYQHLANHGLLKD